MSTFAEQQVSRLEVLLAANTGVDSVMVGSRSVKYGDLLKQYDYWKAIVCAIQEAASRNSGRPFLRQNDRRIKTGNSAIPVAIG